VCDREREREPREREREDACVCGRERREREREGERERGKKRAQSFPSSSRLSLPLFLCAYRNLCSDHTPTSARDGGRGKECDLRKTNEREIERERAKGRREANCIFLVSPHSLSLSLLSPHLSPLNPNAVKRRKSHKTHGVAVRSTVFVFTTGRKEKRCRSVKDCVLVRLLNFFCTNSLNITRVLSAFFLL
jgi:hypothetical protein